MHGWVCLWLRFFDENKKELKPSGSSEYYKMSDLCVYDENGNVVRSVRYYAIVSINTDFVIRAYDVVPSGWNNVFKSPQNKDFANVYLNNLGINIAEYSPNCSNWDIKELDNKTSPTLNGVNYSPVSADAEESTFFGAYHGLLEDAAALVWGTQVFADSYYF